MNYEYNYEYEFSFHKIRILHIFTDAWIIFCLEFLFSILYVNFRSFIAIKLNIEIEKLIIQAEMD